MDLSDPQSGELLRNRPDLIRRAQELGVKPEQYRAWESGKKVPEVDQAMLREMDDRWITRD